jgi:signal transduction histidine kinase
MSPLLLAGWLSAVGSATLLLLARRAARRSTEHVVRACHELRGPLQNVMLALGAVEAGPVARRPPLAALAVELTRASRAVDDLAAVVAGRRTGEEHRRIDLLSLVRDLVAVHDLAARARGRRVELDGPEVPASVLGDRARLTQALSNLVANAVEHGEGTVRVGITHGQGRVGVVVADEGQGLRVPIDVLLRARRRGQRGRGMRIVADALAAHGGGLRSAAGTSGTRLVAELPTTEGRTTGDAARRVAGARVSGARIEATASPAAAPRATGVRLAGGPRPAAGRRPVAPRVAAR